MDRQGRKKRQPGQWITLIGFCTAMEVILARFLSLHTWNLKIGLSFLPVAAAGLAGGPLAGGSPGGHHRRHALSRRSLFSGVHPFRFP